MKVLGISPIQVFSQIFRQFFVGLILSISVLTQGFSGHAADHKPSPSSQQNSVCSQALQPNYETRGSYKAEERTHRSLRFLTMNTKGLMAPDSVKKSKRRGVLERLHQLGQAVVHIEPDIAILQEVGQESDGYFFNATELRNQYNLFFFGKENLQHPSGLLILLKKDLGFDIEARSHFNRKWHDPVLDKESFLFTRDVPALIFRDPDSGEARFIFMGHHARSQRDRSRKDPKNRILRQAQGEGILQIQQELMEEFGQDIPFITAGDFNAEIHVDPSVAPLAEKMSDVFDLVSDPPPLQRRVSHSYFSNNGDRQYQQIDGILVRNSSSLEIRRADVHRYRDANGEEIPLPQNWNEREELPSDHNPIWADILIPRL